MLLIFRDVTFDIYRNFDSKHAVQHFVSGFNCFSMLFIDFYHSPRPFRRPFRVFLSRDNPARAHEPSKQRGRLLCAIRDKTA